MRTTLLLLASLAIASVGSADTFDFVGQVTEGDRAQQITGFYSYDPNTIAVDDGSGYLKRPASISVNVGAETFSNDWEWFVAPDGSTQGIADAPLSADADGENSADFNLTDDGQKKTWAMQIREKVGDGLYAMSNLAGDIISSQVRKTPTILQVADGSGTSNGTIKDGYDVGTDK